VRPVNLRRACILPRRYCDIGFTAFEKTGNLELMRAQVGSFKSLAWKEYDRSLSMWSLAYVIQGDTEKRPGSSTIITSGKKCDFVAAKMSSSPIWRMRRPGPSRRYASAWKMSSPDLAPTLSLVRPSRSLTGLADASDAGLEGVVLSWHGYRGGMDQFREKVCAVAAAGRPSIAAPPVDLEGRSFATHAYDSVE